MTSPPKARGLGDSERTPSGYSKSNNRASFRGKAEMPVLVLSGEHGIPQPQTLGCVRQRARDFVADLVPASGHADPTDDPRWVVERMVQFFSGSRR